MSTSPLPPDDAAQKPITPAEWRPYRSSWVDKLALVIFVLMVLASGAIFAYQRTRLPFNSAQWKSAPTRNALNQRERMCRDLMDSNRLMGLNRTQLVALLGEPDERDVNGFEIGYDAGNTLTGKPCHLLINLEEHGKVVGEALQEIKPATNPSTNP